MGADSLGFRRISRMLVVAMVAVVSSVLASALYARYRLSNAAEVLNIASNAAPSIRQLAIARRHLHRIEFELDHAVAMPGAVTPVASITRERRLFESALATYERLPDFPGEENLQAQLAASVKTFEQALAAAIGRLRAGDKEGARSLVFEQMDPVGEDLDERLADLVELNGDHLAADAATIQHTQQRYNLFVYSLFGGTLVLAALATLLVVRAVRRYFLVLDRRSKELEYFAIQIGHDVLNPLTPIAAALRLAEERITDGEALRTPLERGLRGVDRIQRNVSGLLAFARAGERSAADARAPVKPCVEGVVADLTAGGSQIVVDRVDEATARCADGVLQRIVRAMLADAVGRSNGSDVHVRAAAGRGRICVEVVAGAPAPPGAELFAPRIRGAGSGYPGIELEMLTARHLAETHEGRVGTRPDGEHCVTFVELPTA